MSAPTPEFAPMVPTCRAYGIGRTKAFELAKARLIDTFHVGARRFVRLESLRTLPDRLAKLESADSGDHGARAE